MVCSDSTCLHELHSLLAAASEVDGLLRASARPTVARYAAHSRPSFERAARYLAQLQMRKSFKG